MEEQAGSSAEKPNKDNKNELSAFTLEQTKKVFSFINIVTEFASEAPRIAEKTTTEKSTLNLALKRGQKPLSYHTFLDTLKDPRASDIAKALAGFVRLIRDASSQTAGENVNVLDQSETSKSSSSSNNNNQIEYEFDEDRIPGEDDEMAKQVRQFINKMSLRLKTHELWKNCDESEWLNTLEGLEKFVSAKIYAIAFQPSGKHKYFDEKLRRKINQLRKFIVPKHLDIREMDPDMEKSLFSAASDEVRKMNEYKSPKDKLVCILNCCRIVTNLLTKAAGVQNKEPGADEFLPALIYSVIQANPENLYSNVEYISAYRSPAFLKAEPGYFFTHLCSAMSFIMQSSSKSFTIEADLYETSMMNHKEEEEVDLEQENHPSTTTTTSAVVEDGLLDDISELQQQQQKQLLDVSVDSTTNWTRDLLSSSSPDHHPSFSFSNNNNNNTSALSIIRDDKEALEEWKRRRFQFVEKDDVDMLTIGEIRDLFQEYKILCQVVKELLPS